MVGSAGPGRAQRDGAGGQDALGPSSWEHRGGRPTQAAPNVRLR